MQKRFNKEKFEEEFKNRLLLKKRAAMMAEDKQRIELIKQTYEEFRKEKVLYFEDYYQGEGRAS